MSLFSFPFLGFLLLLALGYVCPSSLFSRATFTKLRDMRQAYEMIRKTKIEIVKETYATGVVPSVNTGRRYCSKQNNNKKPLPRRPKVCWDRYMDLSIDVKR